MSTTATEARHGKAEGLDMLKPAEILALLASGQQAAAKVADQAIPAIARAADLVAAALKSGGKVVYAGAGSAGLVAMADAMELPGTYGIPPERIAILFAGGVPTIADLPGGPEDDASLGERDADIVEAADCVICVSASGSTPYTVAIAETAKRRGAKLVAMANNAGAKLFAGADAAILLETPPEVVAGSTRMGAATAQKIAFNMLSTLAAVKLGHVHDGHMVNLRADNGKLRIRAARMVADIAGIGFDEARAWVETAEGSVKVAVLLAAGAVDVEAAKALLARSDDVLRVALAELQASKSSMKRA
ncbi:N-acetylmuramic acid 6-phosphate etherase [Neorhizobium galegae]|uniref:N-acetylmuramic acid 6-phosphate etherase n=1 Tax=Neorhizobium galegae TaxID=399 RepID=UPI000621B128|nr:N-acetylmuramic acid 6-phosphate etherase [Neorhizobium galegae]MCQ1767146.1 N-acetylmuramic acid 6-phosphate etherase [Neorhizobium galegae]MCQ1846910.1 N-acetylmuramic acid 6-phosphate etherase [Neorhizobium galegae]CDZ41819.1 N-acetylmuramic acid 6-phosphate etherase [Neorhizobium galegae bv. officinalis]